MSSVSVCACCILLYQWTLHRSIQTHLFFTQISHFCLLNFMRLLWAEFSSLSRCLWMAAQLSGLSDAPPSSVSSVNLLRGCFVLSPRSLMEMFNMVGPSIDAWGTALVTGLHLAFVTPITTLWPSQFSAHITVLTANSYFTSLSMKPALDPVVPRVPYFWGKVLNFLSSISQKPHWLSW